MALCVKFEGKIQQNAETVFDLQKVRPSAQNNHNHPFDLNHYFANMILRPQQQ